MTSEKLQKGSPATHDRVAPNGGTFREALKLINFKSLKLNCHPRGMVTKRNLS